MNKKPTKPQQSNKIACILIALAGIMLLASLFLILSRSPSPRTILERNLNDFEYFLSENTITKYENEILGQGDSRIFISTHVAQDKIEKLLSTNIIKDCTANGFICKDPIWHCINTATGELTFERIRY